MSATDAQGFLFHCVSRPGYDGTGCRELTIMAECKETQDTLGLWADFMRNLCCSMEAQRLALIASVEARARHIECSDSTIPALTHVSGNSPLLHGAEADHQAV